MRKRTTVVLTSVLTTAISLENIGATAQIKLDDMKINSGVISISGEADNKNPVTFEIYTKGKECTAETVVAFGEKSAEADGKFEFIAELDKSGEFTLTVHNGSDYKSMDFSYSSKTDRDSFAKTISDMCKEENAVETIGAYFENSANKSVMDSLGIDYDYYNGLSDSGKESICSVIVNADKSSDLTTEKLLDAYNLGLDLVKVNAMGETEIEEVLTTQNYEFENVKFSEITDEALKDAIIGNIKANSPYVSYDEIKEEYIVQNVLYIVNTSKVASVYDNVIKYATELGIADKSDYKTYKSNKSSKADTALVDKLYRTPVRTADELLDALDYANENAEESKKGSGSSGGGGGGGYSSVKGTEVYSDESFTVPSVSETPKEELTGFTDMENAKWAEEAVYALAERKVISGYGDGTFKPSKTVTREEFVKMLVVALGLENENAISSFYDVFDHDWFFPYVSSAYEAGIVKGDNVGCFGVFKEITRQDAAVMASRAIESAQIELSKSRDYAGFADENEISAYALDAVKKLYESGKINGSDNGGFNPMAHCTRAEAAKIIYEIIK